MSTNDEGESPLVRNMWETAIFGFTVTALVFSVPGNLPGIWEGPERTPANFAYGSPRCVESLLRSTGIDIRDNEELMQPGFHEPIYASPKKYDAFMYEFGANMPLSKLKCNGGGTSDGCLAKGKDNQFRYDLATAGGADCTTNAHVYNEPVADWGNGVLDEDTSLDAALHADCKGDFPNPFINSNTPRERIVAYFSTSTTTSTLENAGRETVTTAATTTTTRPKEERVMGPQQANIVLNVFYNQSVSPYLNGEKDQNRCERILHRLRKSVSDKGHDWDLFGDVGNLGEVMMCNIVYGWALGEYCASGLDEGNEIYYGASDNFVSTNAKITDLETALETARGTDGADARATCENVTRVECAAKYLADAANDEYSKRSGADNSDNSVDNAGAPPFMYDSSANGATNIAALVAAVKENPCFMKTGYGRSPVNGGRMFGSFGVSQAADTPGPVIPGTGQNPSVGTAFFKHHKGDADTKDDHKPNHFVDLGTAETEDETLFNSISATEDFQTLSLAGNPGADFHRYNVRTSSAAADAATYTTDFGDTHEFPRVQVPVTQVDSRYIYERFVYDFLVLGQMADAVGREQDFYNMLPAECFSDGSGSGVRGATRFTWTVFLVTLLLFLLPRFFVIAYLTKGYGYTLPLPKVKGDEDSNGLISETTQTKIIFLLSMITGILGFSISMSINPDGPGARDGEVSGLQSWASVISGSIGVPNDAADYNQGDFGGDDQTKRETHITYHFLNDLSNGNYHRAYGLDEDEQYNAYILSIMCAMITVLGVILILFKRVGKGEGSAVLSQGKLIGNWA